MSDKVYTVYSGLSVLFFSNHGMGKSTNIFHNAKHNYQYLEIKCIVSREKDYFLRGIIMGTVRDPGQPPKMHQLFWAFAICQDILQYPKHL